MNGTRPGGIINLWDFKGRTALWWWMNLASNLEKITQSTKLRVAETFQCHQRMNVEWRRDWQTLSYHETYKIYGNVCRQIHCQIPSERFLPYFAVLLVLLNILVPSFNSMWTFWVRLKDLEDALKLCLLTCFMVGQLHNDIVHIQLVPLSFVEFWCIPFFKLLLSIIPHNRPFDACSASSFFIFK